MFTVKQLAWIARDAAGDGPGVVLISGTGSIAYGIKQKLEGPADISPEGRLIPTFSETLDDYNASCRVGTFDHAVLDDCHTEGLTPAKTHWAQPLDTPPFCGYALKPGITFTYLGVKVDERAAVHFGGGGARRDEDGRARPRRPGWWWR